MKGMLLLLAGGAGLLFFGSALVLIAVAWKKCEENMRSQGTKMSRPVALLLCLLLIAGSAIALHSGYSEYKSPPAVEAKAQAKSLGFTVSEFKDRFNEASKRAGAQQRVKNPTVAPVKETDTCETFQVLLGENLGLIGSADKQTHGLDGFVLFMSSETDALSMLKGLAKMLVYSGVVIEMCSPGVSGEQRDGVLREVGLLGGQMKIALHEFDQGKDYVKAAQLGQIRYSYQLSPAGRAYFTVDPL